MKKTPETYDVDFWKANHKCISVNDFSQVTLPGVDGIYSINKECTEKTLDVYLFNSEAIKSSNSLLFCFTGAVGRKSAKAPFFSGIGIANELNLPIVAISDPSLALSEDLTLSWYLGFKGWEDLPSDIASIVEALASSFGLTPLLFGGSGGGFACLNVASRLSISADVFVWNPQTSISDYGIIFVKDYIFQCFGVSIESKEEAYDFFDNIDVCHDLKTVCFSSNLNVYYFQNKRDAHYKAHAIPFLKTQGFQSFESSSMRVIKFILCDYEGGHNPISKPLIKNTIISITNNDVFDNVLEFSRSDDGFELSLEIVSDGVLMVITPVLSNKNNMFAFYLVRNGEILEVTNYSKSNCHYFKVPALERDAYEVIGFYCNLLGEKTFKRMKLLER